MLKIKDSELPDPSEIPSDKVYLIKDRLQDFNNHFKGMLYFCSRILNKPEDEITMLDLKQFEIARFHRHEQYVKNMSFPVSLYLSRIRELEDKLNAIQADC